MFTSCGLKAAALRAALAVAAAQTSSCNPGVLAAAAAAVALLLQLQVKQHTQHDQLCFVHENHRTAHLICTSLVYSRWHVCT